MKLMIMNVYTAPILLFMEFLCIHVTGDDVDDVCISVLCIHETNYNDFLHSHYCSCHYFIHVTGDDNDDDDFV